MARQEGRGSAGHGAGARKRRHGATKNSPSGGSGDTSPPADQVRSPGPAPKKVRFEMAAPSSPASMEMPFGIDDILPPSTPDYDLLPALVEHHASPPPSDAVSAPSTPKRDSVPADNIVEQLWATVLDSFSPPRSPESSTSVIADPAALWATVLDNFSPPTSQGVTARGLPQATSPMFVSDYSDSSPTPAARNHSTLTRQHTSQSGPCPTSLPPPAMTADWASLLEQSPAELSLPDLGAPLYVGASSESEGTMERVEAVGPPPPHATMVARGAAIAGRVVLPITQLSPPHWGAYNEMLAIRASQLFHVAPHVAFQ